MHAAQFANHKKLKMSFLSHLKHSPYVLTPINLIKMISHISFSNARKNYKISKK